MIMKGNKEGNKFNKFYFGFSERVIAFSTIFLVLFITGIFSVFGTFTINDERIINYSEKSKLDYKVYLKENEFYDVEYLDKDRIYIANLIDRIKIDFNYKFEIEKSVNLDFEYDIIAKLLIHDNDEKNVYFEKEYILVEDRVVNATDTSFVNIDDSIELVYDDYNKLANNFKNSYGINTNSKLEVYFNIKKKNNTDDISFISDEVNSMSLRIPLSERSINISMDYTDINNKSNVIDSASVQVNNKYLLIFGIILIFISLIFLFKVILLLVKLRKKRNLYDVYISKILKEYDRLIVETTSSPLLNIKELCIIKVKRFSELLDVRDNVKQPIMYYTVIPHTKCYFYINFNNFLYITTIKEVDLEDGKNEK